MAIRQRKDETEQEFLDRFVQAKLKQNIKDRAKNHCIRCGRPLLRNRKEACKECKRIEDKLYLHNRRAKMKNIIHNFTDKEWIDKLSKTEGNCPMCRKYVGVENLTLDHIFPISKAEEGTVYKIEDVQPLCKSCNCGKNNRIGEKWGNKGVKPQPL